MTNTEYRTDMTVELLQTWGSDEFAANAARVSTGGTAVHPDRLAGLIGYLMREEHYAPFEHLGATFRVEAPLFVLSQITRHRHLSFSVQSGRYTEFNPVFWVPNADRPLVNNGSSARPNLVHTDHSGYLHARTSETLRNASASSLREYGRLLEEGVAKEVARSVLPQNLYTSFYVSGNLRAWLGVLHLRNGSHGYPQHEIVEVAKQIEAALAQSFPISYACWKERADV